MASELRPNNFAKFGSFADRTILAEPIFRGKFFHPQTLDVIRRGTGLATQQGPAERTGEAVSHVDVGVDLDATLWDEVVRTQDIVATQRNMTRRHAKVADVIGGRAFDAPKKLAMLGAVAFRIVDPTLETSVLRALEGLFTVEIRAIEFLRVPQTRLVVKPTTGINGTSLRRLFVVDEELVAHETRVPIRSARNTLKVGR